MADWSEMADAEPGMNGEHVSDALLSAFINKEIADDPAARAVGEHLAECGVCRRELQDLRAVVSLLAELPEPEAPRSFRLTPSMVPVRPLRRDPGYMRLLRGTRWAAAVAAVLLMLVFGTDIVIHRAGIPAAGTMSTTDQAAPADAERAINGPAVGPYSETGADEAPAAAPEAAGGTVPGAVEPEPSVSTLQAPDAAPEADQAMPAIATQAEPGNTGREMPSVWALVELGLALIVVWLLVLSIALPRLYRFFTGRGTQRLYKRVR